MRAAEVAQAAPQRPWNGCFEGLLWCRKRHAESARDHALLAVGCFRDLGQPPVGNRRLKLTSPSGAKRRVPAGTFRAQAPNSIRRFNSSPKFLVAPSQCRRSTANCKRNRRGALQPGGRGLDRRETMRLTDVRRLHGDWEVLQRTSTPNWPAGDPWLGSTGPAVEARARTFFLQSRDILLWSFSRRCAIIGASGWSAPLVRGASRHEEGGERRALQPPLPLFLVPGVGVVEF
jgi:hypothetical protein